MISSVSRFFSCDELLCAAKNSLTLSWHRGYYKSIQRIKRERKVPALKLVTKVTIMVANSLPFLIGLMLNKIGGTRLMCGKNIRGDSELRLKPSL
jgi:hypothetical protein